MPLSEADTRAKLIDPAIHKRGWTEDLICREESAGSIEIIGGKARRRARGRVDYVLRVKVNPNTQPVAVALIEATRRYYQDAAIRAVLEKIARCETTKNPRRALLSLATGAGKTFIAVNLLKRIADAGQLKRALFVCDRDELRTQGIKAFQNVFGADAAEVFRKPDGTNNAKNARIHIATYQTLGIAHEAGDSSFLTEHYPEDYFTHIVIDECHRSAWGKWSQVLTRNSQAVQIGLTATPRQFQITEKTQEAQEDARITANNLEYFGEPVYEYDLAQAIEDGYLAACEIQRGGVNLDDLGLLIDDIMARNLKIRWGSYRGVCARRRSIGPTTSICA